MVTQGETGSKTEGQAGTLGGSASLLGGCDALPRFRAGDTRTPAERVREVHDAALHWFRELEQLLTWKAVADDSHDTFSHLDVAERAGALFAQIRRAHAQHEMVRKVVERDVAARYAASKEQGGEGQAKTVAAESARIDEVVLQYRTYVGYLEMYRDQALVLYQVHRRLADALSRDDLDLPEPTPYAAGTEEAARAAAGGDL